jgi:hypothetical protein
VWASGKGLGLSWQPLSVRDGRAKDEGPYEDVPWHLVEPLRHWIDTTFGRGPDSVEDHNGGPRLAAALREPVFTRPDVPLTVREVTAYLARDNRKVLLDAVDAVLHLGVVSRSSWLQIDELFQLGGSVWQVDPSSGRCLVRRVGPNTTAAFVDASSADDVASAELGEAWTAAYGRNPDASDAWDHSIKAVEAMLIPIVTPAKSKATLGDVVGTLNSQGHLWQLALHGHDGSLSVAPLVSMLRLMWPNPDRHGGAGSRQPSLVEAQAVVHLAVTIVQWARSGVLSKRS